MTGIFWKVVFFQLAWFGCVFLAGTAPLAAAVPMGLWAVIALQMSEDRRTDVQLMLSVSLLGFAMDSTLIHLNVIITESMVSPPWLISMWMGFALTVRWAYVALEDKPLLLCILGGVAGALSYRAGASFGGVDLAEPSYWSLGVIGGCWGVVFPGIVYWSKYLREQRQSSATRSILH